MSLSLTLLYFRKKLPSHSVIYEVFPPHNDNRGLYNSQIKWECLNPQKQCWMRHDCKREGSVLSYSSTPIDSYYCITLANIKVHPFKTWQVRMDAVKTHQWCWNQWVLVDGKQCLHFLWMSPCCMTNDMRKGKFITQNLADISSTTWAKWLVLLQRS